MLNNTQGIVGVWKLVLTIFVFTFVFLFSANFLPSIKAVLIPCDGRYLTLINPVRGRLLWRDKSLKPLISQYQEIVKRDFSATWLLTYDAVNDNELTLELKKFDSNQEFGVFLEVGRSLANDSGVYQNIYSRWSSPDVVFLSAYKQSERRKIIDRLFGKYKLTFGQYPKSIGVWWIDSYSIDYLVKKYRIKTILIVADQEVTDDYGVWGQWWGYPYFPSKANILIPGQSEENTQDAVVIQWAQRDPILAYGGKGTYSLYSMQANDYVRVGKNINYFKDLVNVYLDCQNKLGQITVGLETGMESIEAFPEYIRQLDYLASINNLQSVTMDQFFKYFKDTYLNNPNKVAIGETGREWILTPEYRRNERLGENLVYQRGLAFFDYFVADNSKFLDRRLPVKHSLANNIPQYLFPLLFLILFGLLSNKLKIIKHYPSFVFFILVSYLPAFMNYQKYGWHVFFGPYTQSIPLAQFLIIATPFFILWLFLKKRKKMSHDINQILYISALVYGFDFLVSKVRYTSLDGVKYFGFSLDPLRFVGVKLSAFWPSVVSRDFSVVIASSMLKISFIKLYSNPLVFYFFLPLLHILMGIFIWNLSKNLSKKIFWSFIACMTILCGLYLYMVFGLDPRMVS